MASSRFTMGAYRLLLALAVFLFMPATNVLILINPALVAYEYRQPRIPESERYDPAARLQLAQDTVRYLNSPDDIEVLRAMRYQGEPVYNERELKHMVDVKVVLEGLRWVWRASGVILLAGLALALWRPAWRRPFAWGTFLGGALLVAALAGILVGALLNFDAFFTLFHRVFFSGESWLFAYEDSLIQFYPLQFWMDITHFLGASILLEGLVLGGLSLAYLRGSRGKR